MNMSLSKPSEIICGDCVEQMMRMPDNSIDAVVTDPPYGLAFMGKSWDTHKDNAAFQEWCEEWLTECLRVLKPGGYLLTFGGTRTWHRIACAVEDTGFEIRDSIAWLHGQGFPKSKNVSLAIDKAEGHPNRGKAIPTASSYQASDVGEKNRLTSNPVPVYEAKSDAGKQWEGWGTALKPAFEPIVVARKPLAEKTVAANVLAHGTGGINIDGTRVDLRGETWGGNENNAHGDYSGKIFGSFAAQYRKPSNPAGRWPANLILGHSEDCQQVGTQEDSFARNPTEEWSGVGQKEKPDYESEKVTTSREVWECVIGCPVAELDRQSGTSTSKIGKPRGTAKRGMFANSDFNKVGAEYDDTGGASRFFYQAKANKKERPEYTNHEGKKVVHPTVKPLALMEYLVKLVTQSDGTVLDPFAGSGTTLEACANLGIRCIAIEMDEDYIALMGQRLNR